MKTAWIVRLAVIGLVPALAGCWLAPEPSYDTHYYGLEAPAGTSWPFTVGSVANESGVATRMVYRTGSGERVVDEYRRWLQSPDVMLANYFRDAAAPDRGDLPVFDLRIYRFDADLTRKTVHLGVEWRRAAAGSTAAEWTNFRCEVPFDAVTPEAMAGAFSACAEQLGKELEHK